MYVRASLLDIERVATGPREPVFSDGWAFCRRISIDHGIFVLIFLVEVILGM